MIAEHNRRAYEATNYALNRLRGLLTALDALNDATLRADDGSAEADACCVLIGEARAKLQEVERLRAAEWVAMGGNTEALTPEEIAQARGK